MRIGHYAPDIWAPGGIRTYIRRLGMGQAARGHSIVYLGLDAPTEEASARPPGDHVTLDSEEDLFPTAAEHGLDVLHLHRLVWTLPEDRIPTLRTVHDNQASCPSGTRLLHRTGMPCNRIPSVPGCLWGRYVDRCGNRHPRAVREDFSKAAQERVLTEHLPTITVSSFLRDRMVEAGCTPANVHVLPSPAPRVDGSVVPIPDTTPPRFLFLGRLAPSKGLAWLLRTLARVDVPLHLDVAGEGDYGAVFEERANDLGIASRVTFHGWCSPERVRTLIQQSRAVVVPSIWHEPAGLVTLEAASHGRPVAASKVGGIPEYARPEFARLVPPNDEEALGQVLRDFATDLDEARSMGARGRALATSVFALDRFLDRHEAFYHEVIERSANTIRSPG